jgi:two-component system, cell cycle response regulator DivK
VTVGDHKPRAAGRRVVVVEDNDRSRRLIVHVLGRDGFETTAVATGEEALELVRADPPDLLLLDIQLAGSALDGEAVLRLVREDPRTSGLVVVALTAFAVRGDEERFLAAGFDGYIPKPIDVGSVVGQLLAYLEPSP